VEKTIQSTSVTNSVREKKNICNKLDNDLVDYKSLFNILRLFGQLTHITCQEYQLLQQHFSWQVAANLRLTIRRRINYEVSASKTSSAHEL